MSNKAVPLLLLVCLCAGQLATAFSKISIKEAALVIEETDGTSTESIKLQYSSTLSKALSLDHTQKFKVSIQILGPDGATMRPDQAFLRLTSKAAGQAAYFSASPKRDQLEVVVTSAGIEAQMGTQSGAFEAVLLIGSASPAAAIEWALGEVAVMHHPAPDGNQPPAPKPLFKVEAVTKPEIKHAHRSPEKRTPGVVSLVFTALTLVPLVAFVLSALMMGANTKGFPTSGAGVVLSIGFHVGIAAILGVQLLFWLQYNLIQVLPTLVALEVATLMLGAKATAVAPAAAATKSTKQE